MAIHGNAPIKLLYAFILIPVTYFVFAPVDAAFAQEQRFEQEQIRMVDIPRVSGPPKFEDFINDIPREAELVITDFRQLDPGDGEQISRPTTAFLSYDDKNLYAAFICKDDPSLIRATIARRDGIGRDDRVTVSIDTFRDFRRNYWFEANPYGVQRDGMYTNGSNDATFDTVWYSEGRIVEDGYVVLIAIPFKSLRFPNTPEQTWGVMVSRTIERNNEWANWPYVSWRLMPTWAGQFGVMTGIRDISPGRNMQFIPYIGASRLSLWNPVKPGLQYDVDNNVRAGLDGKLVLRDALTLDMTINPDFSQVESDSPQVTVNQRFEVFFPEKRAFFMENADYFQTVENLFFSRRMADPQFGVRLTGKLGGWGIGVLAGDDRAQGETVPEDSEYYGDRAAVGVFRVYREIGDESRIGALITSRDFAGSHNRVFSLDTRLQLNRNLTLTGQWIESRSRRLDGTHRSGNSGFIRLNQGGRNLNASVYYRDRSPEFETDMGFITRVDMREVGGSTRYYWRPGRGTFISYGPSVSGSVIYDYDGTLTDWTISPQFRVELPRNTLLSFTRNERFEHFAGMDFRKNSNQVSFSSQWQRWMHFSTGVEHGSNIVYRPLPGLQPFSAKSLDANSTMKLFPMPQLQIEETYLYTRLAGKDERGTVINNHIWRTTANYQFTRELSLRAIIDYNAVLPNHTLVPLEQGKLLGMDFLLTYMLNPGTAFYIGYTDNYQNLRYDPMVSPWVQRGSFPDTSVGRQIFAKFSYMLRM